METGISNRAILLIDMANLDQLARASQTNYSRWSNLKRKTARVGADEVEILGRTFPSYRWWLMTGEVMPEIGQTSPEYDLANSNLNKPSAG